MTGRQHVTRLLQDARRGDALAEQALFPLVYEQLRGIARGYVNDDPAAMTLQATALVHEAYLRLFDRASVDAVDRQHFVGIAARVMRQVLVDHARRRRAEKRGGGQLRVSLGEVAAETVAGVDVLVLEEALTRLETLHLRMAKVVELRVFLGMSVAETCAVLGVSRATVDKEWAMARAWLRHELS
ncbi:MAG: sigma-70 family RNA polymerase sigma factor [Planctomycetes bacterium]|nr:sigma-70 family RNA polymerase sigma factor [Planctomycetota bacterium]MCB9870993.1 sigma-70 family RNA polymerase sigma factor [Planctomycetota bacterium]MCB9888353.1 sigma-70 family RNA polymerase sigma factor [Planctomycetota bacterium]